MNRSIQTALILCATIVAPVLAHADTTYTLEVVNSTYDSALNGTDVGTVTYGDTSEHTLDAINVSDLGVAFETAGILPDSYELNGAVRDSSGVFTLLLIGVEGNTYSVGEATQGGPQDFITVDYGTYALIDPVASTPEPSSFVLLGTGVMGLFGAARRKFGR